MARFSDLYDLILPKVRGCETPIVDVAIRRVLRDYMKATTCWRETIPLSLVPNITDYRLVPRAGGDIAGILWMPNATDASREIRVIDEQHRFPPGYLPDPGAPEGYWQHYPGVVSFDRAPDQTYAIQVTVYKQMTQDPTDDFLPEDTYEHAAETIADGVLKELLSMNTVPWKDTAMATYYNSRYNQAKYAERARLRNGGGRSVSRVRGPLFAGR